MNEKFVYLVILGALLILGYPAGCFVARLKGAGRWLTGIVGIAGSMMFFVGMIAANADHRFRILAASGLFLQVAGLVSSFKIRQRPRGNSVDLWVSRKDPKS